MKGVAFFQKTFDVFDGDRSVVNQDSDGEGQAAQGHDVDGFTQRTQRNDGGENR